MFARKEDDKPLHLGLTPHCGLCGTAFVVGDTCTSLLGVNRATEYQRRIPRFPYPKYGFFHGEWHIGVGDDNEDGTMLCRNPECTKGTSTLEACTVHMDCVSFFLRHCIQHRKGKDSEGEWKEWEIWGVIDDAVAKEAFQRLWIAAAWRRPWRQAAWLWLDQPDSSRVSMELLTAAAAANSHNNKDQASGSLGHLLQRLQSLPAELVEMIREQSATSLLWRCAAVLDRCQHMKSPTLHQEGQLLSTPLCSIVAWKRGSLPDTTVDVSELPILRLTTDVLGLRTVERLPNLPLSSHGRRSHNKAYVVVDESEVRGVTIHFKYGLARLELPVGIKGFQIWDTSTPPRLADCHLLLKRVLPTTRFQTIPLDRADGITLFFEHSKVAAVHMHTPATPCARMNLLCLDPLRVVWVYLPIGPKDRILAFGARRSVSEVRAAQEEEEEEEEGEDEDGDDAYGNVYCNFCIDFLFRTKLAGDISVGPMLMAPFIDTTLASEAPISLVFSGIESFILSVAGAYSGAPTLNSPIVKDTTNLNRDRTFVVSLPDISPPFGDLPTREITSANDHLLFLSTAPLDNIVRIRVFSDRVRGFDRGLLFFYENGGMRALGQCRVGGVDDECDYENPACLCISRDGYTHHVKDPAPRQPGTERWHVFYAQCLGTLDHTHDENGIWECIQLGSGCGRLELCYTSKTSRLTVLEDDKDKQEWRKQRHDRSLKVHVRSQ